MEDKLNKIILSIQDDQSNKQKFLLLREGHRQLMSLFSAKGDNLIGIEILVLFIETAIELSESYIADDLLNLYFQMKPRKDEYFARASLCQAQLLAPTSSNTTANFKKLFIHLQNAVNIAKENDKLYHIVYNASVIFWRLSSLLFVKTKRRDLKKSLLFFDSVLDIIDDENYEWRSTLKIGTLESILDFENGFAEAYTYAKHIAHFIITNTPHLVRYFVQILVENKIKTDFLLDFQEINILSNLIDLKINASNEINKEEFLLNTIQELESFADSSTVCEIYLEIGRQASGENMKDILLKCVEKCSYILKNSSILKEDLNIEFELLQCELGIVNFQKEIDSIKKNDIEMRLKMIRRCESVLKQSSCLGCFTSVQIACITQWNLCLPLLQPNLTKMLTSHLCVLSQVLDSIPNSLPDLESKVNFELAKCYANMNELNTALEYCKKAICSDESNILIQCFNERLLLAINFELKPGNSIDEAMQLIELVRYSEIDNADGQRAFLVNVGLALTRPFFSQVLDLENKPNYMTICELNYRLEMQSNWVKNYYSKKSKILNYFQCLEKEDHYQLFFIWSDLAKLARKKDFWDVARAATDFALIFEDCIRNDDYPESVQNNSQKLKVSDENSKEKLTNFSDQSQIEIAKNDINPNLKKSEQIVLPVCNQPKAEIPIFCSKQKLELKFTKNFLLKLLTEIKIIRAELSLHFLKSEGFELGDEPVPPAAINQQSPNHSDPNFENWIAYVDWINWLGKSAVSDFLDVANIGVELNENYLIVSSAAYLWNYHHNCIMQQKFYKAVEPFKQIFNLLMPYGHGKDSILLVAMARVIALGQLQPLLSTNNAMASSKKALDEKKSEDAKKKKVPTATRR